MGIFRSLVEGQPGAHHVRSSALLGDQNGEVHATNLQTVAATRDQPADVEGGLPALVAMHDAVVSLDPPPDSTCTGVVGAVNALYVRCPPRTEARQALPQPPAVQSQHARRRSGLCGQEPTFYAASPQHPALTVYVWQEPDQRGATFVRRVGGSLPGARVMAPAEGRKDASECHLLGDHVPAVLKSMMRGARPRRELQTQAQNREAEKTRLAAGPGSRPRTSLPGRGACYAVSVWSARRIARGSSTLPSPRGFSTVSSARW